MSVNSTIYPYAGFWRRVLAAILDSFIVGIPLLVLFVLALVGLGASNWAAISASGQELSPDMQLKLQIFMASWQLFSPLAFLLYGAWLESGEHQSTWGKRIAGIKVVDQQGERLSFWRAFGRNIGKWISTAIMSIGYFMAGATSKKQALHDIMASAYVVDKQYTPGEELPEVQTHWGLLILAVVLEFALIALPFIFLFGMLLVAGVSGATAA